jgi:hypothetical protein
MDMVQAPAKGFVAVTPSANPLPNIWNYFYCGVALTVTVEDHYGHVEADVPLVAGYHYVAWKKVTAVSGGTLYRCHNNDKQPDTNA